MRRGQLGYFAALLCKKHDSGIACAFSGDSLELRNKSIFFGLLPKHPITIPPPHHSYIQLTTFSLVHSGLHPTTTTLQTNAKNIASTSTSFDYLSTLNQAKVQVLGELCANQCEYIFRGETYATWLLYFVPRFKRHNHPTFNQDTYQPKPNAHVPSPER